MGIEAVSRFDYQRRAMPERYDDHALTPRLGLPSFDYIFRHGRLHRGAVFAGDLPANVVDGYVVNASNHQTQINYVPEAGDFNGDRGAHIRIESMIVPPTINMYNKVFRVHSPEVAIVSAVAATWYQMWIAPDGYSTIYVSVDHTLQGGENLQFDIFVSPFDVRMFVDDALIIERDFPQKLEADFDMISIGGSSNANERWQGDIGPVFVKQMDLNVLVIDGSDYVIDSDGQVVV